MERNDPPVHLRADRAVPDVGVYRVGEVDRRRAGRQRLHLVLRREDEHLLVEEIRAEALHELARVGLVGVDVHELPHPGVPLLGGVLRAAPVSDVGPVRGDSELGRLVHRARPHLDLERTPLRTDHGRMEGAVAVELRHRDVVLEAAGHRLPEGMDQAERAVAVARALLAFALDDHAHRGEVVDLVELAALASHLVVDRVEVLRAAGDVDRDVDLLELAPQHVGCLGDLAFAVGAPLGDHRLDLRVLARVQRLEGEVLELPLERVDAEPVGERRVDLERLPRLLDLLLLAEVLDRAEVVEAVGELDEDDTHVLGHRHDHLSVVLGLRLLAGLELDTRQLGDAVDERGDLLAELLAQRVELDPGVLDDVVEQRGSDGLLVEAQARADRGDADGMRDERLARAALLALVCGCGKAKGARNELDVDVCTLCGKLGEQRFEELFVPLPCLQRRHCLSVLRGFGG